MATFILKKDDFRLGLLLGLIGPIVGALIIYYAKYPDNGLITFIKFMFQTKPLITAVGSVSLLANAVLFTIYVNTRRDRTAAGIFVLTLIYGVSILLVKLLM